MLNVDGIGTYPIRPLADQTLTRFQRGKDGFLLSEGVVALRDHHGAYWLLASIFAHQGKHQLADRDHQLWTLEGLGSKAALLTCRVPGEGAALLEQPISYANFPVGQTLRLHLVGPPDRRVLCRPEER